MTEVIVTIAAAAAALGGAALAQLNGPLSCAWPDRGQALLRRLKAVKVYRRPGVARTVAGGVLIAALLGAGAFTAYAAEPSAPQQLAKAVVGVVGSGDQLGLSLKEAGAAPRTLKVGDDYKDGWKLAAVTPTTATLTKDGAAVEVGLNPTGAVVPAIAAAGAAPQALAPSAVDAPSALQQLPRIVVEVVPGAPMGLRLKEDGAAPRVLKVGEDYKEGWKLIAVLSTGAMFSKGDVTAELPLAPVGAGAPTLFGPVRTLPPSQMQIDLINNEKRSAQIAALRAAQGNPTPTPAALAQIERNNASIALVTAQNQYIRASAMMSIADGIMRDANTDDFSKAVQGPAAQSWADALWQLGGCVAGGEGGCSYETFKAVVDKGPPTVASVAQQRAAVAAAGQSRP